MAPSVHDFLPPGRDARVMNAAIREMRAWPPEDVHAFVRALVEKDVTMGLDVARRLLRGRRVFEQLLEFGFTLADVSTIRLWLDGLRGPLSPERIIELYDAFARGNPERAREFSFYMIRVFGNASVDAIGQLADVWRMCAGEERAPRPSLMSLLIELSTLQTQLLDELHRRYPVVASSEPWNWPSRVLLQVVETDWLGRRHGLGFRFTSRDGRIVEAHDYIRRAPYPIDAWRLAEYARSIRAAEVVVDDDQALDLEGRDLEGALKALSARGLLKIVNLSHGPGRYLVVGAP